MADIFLSYKKEDFEIADRLVGALRKEGMSVWWDDGLTPKDAWDAEIEREISAASTVVVLWSPRSYSSEWVRREAHFAQDRGKLVPVMVEATEVPIAFTLNQTVNLIGWDGSGENRQWRKLLTWITDLVTTKPSNANMPQVPGAPPTNRFRDILGYMASGDPIVDGTLVNASTPAGTAFRDGEQRPVMRVVPKGSFLLGATADDPDHASYEVPQKRIDIPAPFAIGVFPILVSEYQNITGSAAPAPATFRTCPRVGMVRKAQSRDGAGRSCRATAVECSCSDHPRFLRRSPSVCGPARLGYGRELPHSLRGGVGICLPCGLPNSLPLWERDRLDKGSLRSYRRPGRARIIPAQRLRPS